MMFRSFACEGEMARVRTNKTRRTRIGFNFSCKYNEMILLNQKMNECAHAIVIESVDIFV